MILEQQQPETLGLQQEVCAFLSWKTGEHTLFIFERGYEYLTEYFDGDEVAIKKVTCRPAFWNWWRNMWYIRDEVYMSDMAGWEHLSAKSKELVYRSLHDAKALVCEIAIPPTVYPKHFPLIKAEMVCTQE